MMKHRHRAVARFKFIVLTCACWSACSSATAQSFTLDATNVGQDNPAVAPHVPVSQLTGFGHRTRLGQWVPFAFDIPAHSGPSLQAGRLEVTIAQIQTTAAGADTISASGTAGWPGEELFRDFNTLYVQGEDPKTPKVIEVDLLERGDGGGLLFPNTVEVIETESRLHIAQQQNSSVLGARLTLAFGDGPPVTPDTRTPTPNVTAGTATPTRTGTQLPTASRTIPAGTSPTPSPAAGPDQSKCRVFASTDVPKPIPDAGLARSLVDVAASGPLTAVRVRSLRGTHPFVHDLEFRLVSPTGTQAILLDRPCHGFADFDVHLDDDASGQSCPIVGGATMQPLDSLARFAGEPVRGTWTLEVFDRATDDVGTLDGWALEVCHLPEVTQPDCSTYLPDALPKRIADLATLSSTVDVPDAGPVAAVSVLAVNGTHPSFSDLDFRLIGPSGREVRLLDRACPGTADFDLAFDDLETTTVPCPATDGLAHRPVEALESFAGDPSAGRWTLAVRDSSFDHEGTLDNWALRVCAAVETPIPTATRSGTAIATPTRTRTLVATHTAGPAFTATRSATPTPTRTATPTSTFVAPPCPCPGDCNCNGQVTVDELVLLVSVALGERTVSSCGAGDANGDGQVGVDDLIRAIERILAGCA